MLRKVWLSLLSSSAFSPFPTPPLLSRFIDFLRFHLGFVYANTSKVTLHSYLSPKSTVLSAVFCILLFTLYGRFCFHINIKGASAFFFVVVVLYAAQFCIGWMPVLQLTQPPADGCFVHSGKWHGTEHSAPPRCAGVQVDL